MPNLTTPGRPRRWTSSDLLQADYTIDTYERRGKRWRAVVDIGAPYNVTIGDIRSLVPLPRRATLLETQHASFECRSARLASGL